MSETECATGAATGGVRVCCRDPAEARAARTDLSARLTDLAGAAIWQPSGGDGEGGVEVRLATAACAALAPGYDTLGLAQRLAATASVNGRSRADADHALECEILASWLLGPQLQVFPSLEELASAVRVRANTVRAARLTALNFDPSAVARPVDCWIYDEDRGFHVREGSSLIEALRKASQPGASGPRYAFSCYRASEYVLLLGLAEELQACNPPLYRLLDALWHRRAIASGEFHDVFLSESGSTAEPLPARWYVPGDRVWFRNPDAASADASGYEGSWVVYLGQGRFSNFWKPDEPYDFDEKCLEIYHWRNAVFQDVNGDPRIDEDRVAMLVATTRSEPLERARVLERMQRYRDVRGVYAEGGCIDSTREQVRWVCPGTATLTIPLS